MPSRLSLMLLALCALLALADAAIAKKARIKNVLYLISDDLKASVLGCYGDPFCRTPNIDKLARASMLFTRAYCQGTSCAPSRVSIMHSRYVGGRGESNRGRRKGRKNGGGFASFPEHFKNHGWHTARVNKIYHMRVPGDIIAGTDGIDDAPSWTEKHNCKAPEAHTPGEYACLNLNIFTPDMKDRQSTGDPYRMFVTVVTDGNAHDQADFVAAEKAVQLLRERKKSDKPFLLAVGFVRPHYPMVAPKNYFDLYPWAKMKLPEKRPDDWDDIPQAGLARSSSQRYGIDKFPGNQKRMWAGYYASVSFMDAQVGRVLDELDRLGLRDETAVVFTSDHGYHLGEHDFWQKANLHEEVTRAPLLISVPGFKPGRTDALAELLDIFPTLTDLAGISTPDFCHGTSLVPVLEDPRASVKDYAFTHHQNQHNFVRSARWAYMSYGKDGSQGEELYDMDNDPRQFTNLAKQPQHEKVIRQHRAALKKRLAGGNQGPTPDGHAPCYDLHRL